MLRVTLKEYQSRIEGLLEENRQAEAAAHCHFLLQQYPRHIGTYRLFGRALLEQKLYNDAIDIFKRVISANPEDLIARAGLSLAYREKQDYASAIWHMERALEIEPYNVAIQDELSDLKARSGGVGSRRVNLNRAALARLYFQGALYAKAARELEALVEEQPDRFDLQVLLAETYYWDDRRIDAVKQCQRIIEQLPYCIKANAILADLWLRGGRFSDARKKLSDLQSLTLLTADTIDINTTVGKALSNHRDISLPERIGVDALDEVAATYTNVTSESEWLTDIGLDGNDVIETDIPSSDDDAGAGLIRLEESGQILDDDEYAWLKNVNFTDEGTNAVTVEPEVEVEEELPEVVDSPLADIDDSALPLETMESEKQSEETPELFDEDASSVADYGEELPSWSDLGQEEEQAEPDPFQIFTDAEWLNEIAPDSVVDDELPDWLHEEAGLTDELRLPSDYDLPDWLVDPVDEVKQQPDISDYTQDSTRPHESVEEQALVDRMDSDDSLSQTDHDHTMDLNSAPEVDELAVSLPGWLTDFDNQADSPAGSEIDRPMDAHIDRADGPIPWLDDLTDDAGDTEEEQAYVPPPVDLAEDQQSEADSGQ